MYIYLRIYSITVPPQYGVATYTWWYAGAEFSTHPPQGEFALCTLYIHSYISWENFVVMDSLHLPLLLESSPTCVQWYVLPFTLLGVAVVLVSLEPNRHITTALQWIVQYYIS